MRRIILVLVLLVAACTSAPKPTITSAAGLAPLAPCPASSWKPEAPPPTASAKTSMVLLAVGESAPFGQQVLIYSADAAPRTPQPRLKQSPAPHPLPPHWPPPRHPARTAP